ncbi:MAG: hypothetical protein A2312_03310 [Candidatus Staskawiczbacteria bacterium RIFOXYB2_FULL_32_9]|uniref:Uncharacterized protein n=1 Tax=Candidatus Staskawiczbacteria bacterium RIFOXYD1_FULL_32_13 TaxID=1802234 RepID=A0A1G2JM85_9BACT|nr:MAG: hypothetical protein UR22_C0029G0005 [Parcubacteria group bacterium GW2011_GWC2_32_10]OGZ78788.1 MAG: hypothetical protein A2360_00665 [Candidatus Staskawiczbacteria bacterium RIFOXYB1_FULL_32_11]OGZ83290.1 MAG: hypothetical protein A2312_03310 [Candidatus Staskawiczbacteria bacterium RIFOXYB2_FULL_32_9]OGZ87345.1 MAG: hypothetical protein A2463_01185 [Candidatus Staskawiczbacteria bacterium RIFOXYC2_FULL_32_10]OGZ88257.1 MAG: hypothetical protein A2561_04860 [Candidatus Staskawiczbacte
MLRERVVFRFSDEDIRQALVASALAQLPLPPEGWRWTVPDLPKENPGPSGWVEVVFMERRTSVVE